MAETSEKCSPFGRKPKRTPVFAGRYRSSQRHEGNFSSAFTPPPPRKVASGSRAERRESIAWQPVVLDPPPYRSELDLGSGHDHALLRRSIGNGWKLTQTQLTEYARQLCIMLDRAFASASQAIENGASADTIRKLSRDHNRCLRTLATIAGQQQAAEMHEDKMGRLLRGESTENVQHAGDVQTTGSFALTIDGDQAAKMPLLQRRLEMANGGAPHEN